MTPTLSRSLELLEHSAIELADPAEDTRGREVRDQVGEHIGRVEDVLVDPGTNRARMLVVTTDGLLGIGKHRYLVPLAAVRAHDGDALIVDRMRDQVTGGPEHDDAALDGGDGEQDMYEAVYAWYELQPYWVQPTS
jgi:sporulation protein YlmC with PRC-barrel domain